MLNPLFFLCLIVMVGLFFWMLATCIKRIRTGQAIIEFRGIEQPIGLTDGLGLLFFWFAGQGIALTLGQMKLGLQQGQEPNAIQLAQLLSFLAGSQLLISVVTLSYLLLRYRSPIAAFIQKGKLRSDLFLGLAGFFLIIPPILGVQAILTQYVEYKHSTQQLLVQNASLFTIVATWFAAVVMAPISEEIFFRGVLQGFLHRLIPESNATPEEKLNGGWSSLNLGSDSIPLTKANPNVNKRTQSLPAGSLLSDNPFLSPENRGPKSHPVAIPRMKPLRLSSYWPILVSALLFAFAHFGQGPAPIPLFLLGLGLGYIFLQTGSILPCIVIHMALNGFSMFWFTLNVILGEPDSVSEEVITTLCHDQVILFARWFF